MQSDPSERWAVFVSCDKDDENASKRLATFLESSYRCSVSVCASYRSSPEERYTSTKKLHESRVFILLLSGNTLEIGGKIKKELWHDYVESINYSRKTWKIVLLMVDPSRIDIGRYGEMSKRALAPDKRLKLIDWASDDDPVRNERLHAVLSEIGIPALRKATDEPFDVFISYKSSDYAVARQVAQALEKNGLRVFISRDSLPALQGDEYMEAIHSAIDLATHLIVVCTDARNAKSTWVKHEWRLFLGEKLAGRKTGRLITVTSQGVSLSDLPIELRNREVVQLSSTELERLVAFLTPNEKGIPSDSSPLPGRLSSGASSQSQNRTSAETGSPAKTTNL